MALAVLLIYKDNSFIHLIFKDVLNMFSLNIETKIIKLTYKTAYLTAHLKEDRILKKIAHATLESSLNSDVKM